MSKKNCLLVRMLVLAILLNFGYLVNASTIHWITFVDTDDPHIGALDENTRKVLYDRLINRVNSEIVTLGYEYKVYDYLGSVFSSESCRDLIENIQCDSTDIIFFYYVGHGAHVTTDESIKYPVLQLNTRISDAIPLSWVHHTLKNKNVQLTLTFAVCSNKYMNVDDKIDIEEIMLPLEQRCENVVQNDSSLASAFTSYRGDIILCTASPGQDSWGLHTPLGNIDAFTYNFVSSFEKRVSENNFIWTELLEEVAIATNKTVKEISIPSVQIPFYNYNLTKIR